MATGKMRGPKEGMRRGKRQRRDGRGRREGGEEVRSRDKVKH